MTSDLRDENMKASRDLSPAASGAVHTPGPWLPISEAPRDGTPVWGFLHETGIRLLRWMSPEECAAYEDSADVEDYDGAWIEVVDADEDWSPEVWAPLDAIPLPENASARIRAAIAKATQP